MEKNERVVVITGATSGIGRAGAIRFAERGWIVVLAGRRAEALEEAAQDCRAVGGRASALVTDVTSEEQVMTLAEFALRQTGCIDAWVNNAGVTLFGSLEAVPITEHRQVIETNLFGAIHGARAVLPIFRRQRRGVLINMGSVLSQIGQPFVPSYVISKFALRGLTEALRSELANEADIHVCSLLPYAVDTEHFQSGANHIGRDPHVMPPMQSPEKVARALVRLAERPARERRVPRIAVLGLAAHALFPRAVERVIFDALSKWHFGHARLADTAGNLYRPNQVGGSIHGERQPVVSAARMLLYAIPRFAIVQTELLLRSILPRARLTAPPPIVHERAAPSLSDGRESVGSPVP